MIETDSSRSSFEKKMPQTVDVCYVIPELSRDSKQHFHHYHFYLETIAQRIGLYVIAEKGTPDFHHREFLKGLFVQRWSQRGRIFRTLELILIYFRVRRAGCRRFFIRISIPAAVVIGILARLTGGTVYYWNSGQGKSVLPNWFQDGMFSWSRLRGELRFLPLRVAIKISHKFVTGPKCMVEYYHHHFGVPFQKSIVLYNHVDTNLYRTTRQQLDKNDVRLELGLDVDSLIVLFLGRISVLKGGGHILPFSRALFSQKGMENTQVLCVGPVHLGGFLKEHQEFPWKNRVHIIGAVSGRDVLKYYLASDVFFLPSESEGFPRVLLEAMAAGLAFSSFDVGGVKEIVGSELKDYVVNFKDVKALAAVAAHLLCFPEERNKVSQKAMARAAAFDTCPMADMFVERVGRVDSNG